MTRVPSDPARIDTGGISFRVRLAPPASGSAEQSISGMPIVSAAAGTAGDPEDTGAIAIGPISAALGHTGTAVGTGIGGPRPARRRIVLPSQWSGEDGAQAAASLLAGAFAARSDGRHGTDLDSTQALPRIGSAGSADAAGSAGSGVPTQSVPASAREPVALAGARVMPRSARRGGAGGAGGVGGPGGSSDTALLPPVRFGTEAGGGSRTGAGPGSRPAAPRAARPERERDGAEDPRRRLRLTGIHAWYPGRRMNLGLVLLPMRIVLGVMLIGAGFGKLTDPVYFDGGRRGSMMRWLESLHPWSVAEPLLALAVAHPVGAGLAVSFVQIAVGTMSVLGLWQRLCAGLGMLLSATLLLTVSWRAVPVYDAPDLLFLAAWSPLLLAGAPLFSLDSKLASDAWRRFQPRPEVWQLRRRVTMRGLPIAALVIGLTLLLGAGLGASTRDQTQYRDPGMPAQRPAPGDRPSKAPKKGFEEERRGRDAGQQGQRKPERSAKPSTRPSVSPSGRQPADGSGTEPGRPGGQPPSVSEQGRVEQAPPATRSAPPAPEPQPQPGTGGADGGGDSGGGRDDDGVVGGILGSGGLLGRGLPAGQPLV
jgi:uncharacterized membrane protein YphA (DoxX/SURF4 family)